MPVFAALLADVVIGDPDPLVAGGVGHQRLYALAIGLFHLGPLAQRPAEEYGFTPTAWLQTSCAWAPLDEDAWTVDD